tara:strand:- start:7451 stop:8107 length:657 start_codon:yes stop_codon:yes gene_type:complete
MTTSTVITVRGTDASEFLQGQLSNDILRLQRETSILAAWCNPKGRVITLMTVANESDGYALRVPAELATALVQRMTMFRFRSKVAFETDAVTEPVDLGETIRHGVPWVGSEQSEKFTPHMLNLDKLDAISLEKGCYTGQEIIARTHYKGATKRRMLRFSSAVPVAVGDRISDENRDLGEVLNVAGNELLAIIPVANADSNLQINGNQLTPQPLPYSLD